MENRELNEMLEKIFSNVNTWLNFAEAKNAANIAVVVACLAAFLSIDSMNVCFYIICILFSVSGLFSIISFIPKLEKIIEKNIIQKVKKIIKKITNEEGDNLLFFETIKKYSGDEYAEQVSKIYFNIEKKELSRYQYDMANEIVTNSAITSRKYEFFTISAYLDVIAFVLFGMCFIIA